MDNNRVMKELESSLLPINDIIRSKEIIYLDYPVHHNLGDMLIYLGALHFFHKNGYSIVAQFSYHDYSIEKIYKLLNLYPNATIVFHGGGNFGDIYPWHQKFRERVIAEFIDVQIVILPQTIFFKDSNAMLASGRKMKTHANLHLLVRDKHSFYLAKNFTNNVYLLPDMAHQLWHEINILGIKKKKSKGILSIERKDCESMIGASTSSFDWDGLLTFFDLKFERIFIKLLSLKSLSSNGLFFAKIWELECRKYCRKGIHKINLYDVIKTDRLHGHILALLMSKKSIVINNSYGKNYNYIDIWTKNSDLTQIK